MPQTASTNTGFDEWFITAFNSGTLMLMVSIGHRTGLFDAMAELDWTDSNQLAEKAGLQERYVREWLGAMATGGIVDVNDGGRYRLPAEHGRFLTRNSDAENLASFAQYVAILGAVEDDIANCFRSGGGVPYEKYGRFHEVMAEDSEMTVVEALEEFILPLVPEVQQKLADGIRVLDLGCGRGKALLKMAEQYPDSRFHGIDLSEEAISWARKQVREHDLANIT
ncbi:MAG: methyltransferase domain-containing protein, partial [Balneolaceae bacterium]|nr:methyltransferase domain-containing protein [Balneolaceae bacterium]